MQTPKQSLRVSFSQVGAANTSTSFRSAEVQASFVDVTSSRYSLEPYGLVQPLQVREVLKTSRDHIERVQLHQSGWALLVIKTKIYLWRYNGKSQICKEFVLPSTEASMDDFSTDLVCFYPPPPSVHTTPFPRHIGLVAVSPAGVAYSWNNVLQHDKAKGCIEKLVVEGGGAHSLQCIPEIGCLLATKDCRYYIITPTTHQGQSTMTVKQLSSTGSIISGFARRFSSVWFQSNEAAKVLRKVVISSFMDNKYVYILTDTRIEKWSIGQGHQQIYDVLLEPLIAERLPSEPEDNLMLVEYIDLKVIDDQLLILVSMVTTTRLAEVSHDDIPMNKMATLATVVLSADTPSPRLQDIIVINSEVTYQDDTDLFKWRLLDKECCYDNTSILSNHGSHGDRLECRQDKIMGSGYFGKDVLLFLAKAGVTRLQVKSLEASKYTPVVVKKAKKHSMRRSLLPQEMPTDDHLNVLKKAFQYYCEGNADEAHLLLQQQFFPSFSQWQQHQGSDCYGDIATVEISNLLLDDIPDADPRWAENQSQGCHSYMVATLHTYVNRTTLEDKLIAHERLMQFFIDTGVMARLTAVTVDGRRLRTVDYLSEHAEKLVAAMTMKQLPNETFDGAIGIVMESRRARGVTIKPNLTLQDLFYREVSCIEDIFKALLEDEEQKLKSLTDHNNRIRLVATVLSAYETILHEACQRRHSKYSFYHTTDVMVHVEFIPWTATDHLRQLVARQLDIVVSMGIQETTYQHKELLWQSVVALVDIILNGYCEQIESIRDIDKKTELNCLYEVERARLLQLLTQIGLANSVISLAEKYRDFPTIMSVCESNNGPRRSEMLHDYMIHFVNEDFAKFVFQKYKEQGRIKELMSAPVECHHQLEEFLTPYEELRWMHEVDTKQYHLAYSSLATCAANSGQQSLAKQKNYLSISKLSLLASSCPLEEKQIAMEELELKLRLIDYQENLIRNYAKDDVEEFLVPLSADQLIEYYTVDYFDDITAAMKLNNFLCALEILSVFYQDRQADNFHQLQLVISTRAILQNDWQHIPAQDTLGALKIVFFFQLAQAALDKGLDVLQLLPSLQELSSCDQLCEVNHLPSFIAIMNSGYEQLDRVTNGNFDDTSIQ